MYPARAGGGRRVGYGSKDGSGYGLPDHGGIRRAGIESCKPLTARLACGDARSAVCIHKNHILINASHVLLRKIKPLLRTCKRQHAATDEILLRLSGIIHLWDDSHFGLLFGFGP